MFHYNLIAAWILYLIKFVVTFYEQLALGSTSQRHINMRSNSNVSVSINLLEIKRPKHPLYQSALNFNFILLIRGENRNATCRLITGIADILKCQATSKEHLMLFSVVRRNSRESCAALGLLPPRRWLSNARWIIFGYFLCFSFTSSTQ